MSKSLVAFYSRADENYFKGMLKILDIGNTEVVAETIKEFTSSDIFKIEQEEPYSNGYNECIEQARKDQRENKRPVLKEYPKSLDDYDVIYLGYPNYWGTMPMAVFTFLEHFDFDKKVIKPFCTHEGSGMGNSVRDIKMICKNSVVENGIAIRGSSVFDVREEIKKWI